jgi:hypothetical protein
MWIAAIFFALILSALNVAPALADEAPPPEPAPTEEAADVSTPAETGEEATPPAEGTTDTASSTESSSVAEVIESLPADTTLVVIDENGEALPLASEQAAEIIYNGDPLWCPVGVAPKPNMGGCSPSFTSFTNDLNPDAGLLDWLYNVATPAQGVKPV